MHIQQCIEKSVYPDIPALFTGYFFHAVSKIKKSAKEILSIKQHVVILLTKGGWIEYYRDHACMNDDIPDSNHNPYPNLTWNP